MMTMNKMLNEGTKIKKTTFSRNKTGKKRQSRSSFEQYVQLIGRQIGAHV